jgi:hypothetical protein
MKKEKTMLKSQEKKSFIRMSMCAGIAAAILFMPAIGSAGNDPWKSKPFQEWNDKDISRVLSDSPWAQVVPVTSSWKALPPDAEPSADSQGKPMSKGGTGKSSEESATRTPDSNYSAPGSDRPDTQFNVFWLSSKTVREALGRRAELHSGKSAAEVEQYVNAPQEEYQILIQGQDMTPFRLNDDKFFAANSSLQVRKNGLKLPPSHVLIQKNPDGKSVAAAVFYFPKKTAQGEAVISPDEKSVEFTCKMVGSTLKATFDPQKMTGQSGADL